MILLFFRFLTFFLVLVAFNVSVNCHTVLLHLYYTLAVVGNASEIIATEMMMHRRSLVRADEGLRSLQAVGGAEW